MLFNIVPHGVSIVFRVYIIVDTSKSEKFVLAIIVFVATTFFFIIYQLFYFEVYPVIHFTITLVLVSYFMKFDRISVLGEFHTVEALLDWCGIELTLLT